LNVTGGKPNDDVTRPFQEIETNDPAVDLEVATIDAGGDDGEIDD
jgi:hypothetical protein